MLPRAAAARAGLRRACSARSAVGVRGEPGGAHAAQGRRGARPRRRSRASSTAASIENVYRLQLMNATEQHAALSHRRRGHRRRRARADGVRRRSAPAQSRWVTLAVRVPPQARAARSAPARIRCSFEVGDGERCRRPRSANARRSSYRVEAGDNMFNELMDPVQPWWRIRIVWLAIGGPCAGGGCELRPCWRSRSRRDRPLVEAATAAGRREHAGHAGAQPCRHTRR